MRVLVTGSTGFIGVPLCLMLRRRGYEVRGLYRSEEKAAPLRNSGIDLVKGDILDRRSIERAVEGCGAVVHSAAFTGVWSRSTDTVRRLNVDAVRTVLSAAGEAGVRRVVFTSTAGVLGPSARAVVTEETARQIDFFTPYERTKAEAEEAVREFAAAGLDVSIVNPTRVYGPGVLSDSNGVTRMVKLFVEGKWRYLPGDGSGIGNYAFVDDVVEGHILALEHGEAGERYILGGENATYERFFEILSRISGVHPAMIRVPVGLLLAASGILTGAAAIFGTSPPLTPSLVRKYTYHWEVSSDKAIRELSYRPRGLEEGLRSIVEWLSSEGI